MRINEYNSLKEFYDEYAYGKSFPWQNNEQVMRYMGIEFRYRGNYYRMCNEPIADEKLPLLSNGKRGHYDVMKLHCEKNFYLGSDYYENIGWFENLDDVLDNCYIDGRQFREVIMDDDTEILGKD